MSFDPSDPDDIRALQEQAHQLEELTRHPGWSVLVDYIQVGDGMLGHHQKYLLGGLCKNPEEYQRYAGWVHGCSAVIGLPAFVRSMSDKYSVKVGVSSEPE